MWLNCMRKLGKFIHIFVSVQSEQGGWRETFLQHHLGNVVKQDKLVSSSSFGDIQSTKKKQENEWGAVKCGFFLRQHTEWHPAVTWLNLTSDLGQDPWSLNSGVSIVLILALTVSSDLFQFITEPDYIQCMWLKWQQRPCSLCCGRLCGCSNCAASETRKCWPLVQSLGGGGGVGSSRGCECET